MNIKYYGVKVLDIGLLGIYFLISGVIFSLIINKISLVGKDYKKQPTIILLLDVFLTAALAMIAGYLVKNIIWYKPSFLHNVAGYDHIDIDEISGGVMLAFAIFSFSDNFNQKLRYVVYKRIYK